MLERINSGGKDGGTLARFKISYCYYVCSGDSTQNWFSVIFFFDAVGIRIKEIILQVKHMHSESDNSRCYKSFTLLIEMVLTTDKHELEMNWFIHSGFQNRKCPLDGQYATAMHNVSIYCDQGIVTLTQLVAALGPNGRLQNSTTELVGIYGSAMDDLLAMSLR